MAPRQMEPKARAGARRRSSANMPCDRALDGYLKLEKSDRNCTSRHQQVLKRWTPFEPAEHVYVGAMACVAVLGAALEDHAGV